MNGLTANDYFDSTYSRPLKFLDEVESVLQIKITSTQADRKVKACLMCQTHFKSES